MKTLLAFLAFLVSMAGSGAMAGGADALSPQGRGSEAPQAHGFTGSMAYFTENRGQWDSRVCFEAQLQDGALFAERGAVTVALKEHCPHPVPSSKWNGRHHAYRMLFVGSNGVEPTGIGETEGYSNYYIGSGMAQWRTGVRSYESLVYSNLYDNIDLELYGGKRAFKYNIIVHPGGNVGQVVMEYEGPESVKVGASGVLTIGTSVRDIVEQKPFVYQADGDGRTVEVESRWRVEKVKGERGKWRVWIEVGDYDRGRDLVLDPVLLFSTYTGSTADNWGTTAAYDSKKNVYTAGLVFNVGYPVSTGAYQTSFGGEVDIAVFKFDSTGSNRLFATYLGGSGSDMPHSMFVNSFDELLIFGTTGSNDFPVTAGAYQTNFAGGHNVNYLLTSAAFPQGSDLFVSRLSENGNQLKASTYVGGSGNDGLNYRQHLNSNYQLVMTGNDSLYYNYGDGARGEIITDNLNNVYVGSTTFSFDFPVTAGCVQPACGGRQDGVVLKLDHNLRNLLWSTYLGGGQDDAVYSIDVDSAYNLLVCGGTASTNFPTTDGAFQESYGGGTADGFVSKISYNGDRIMASTYLGSGLYDQLYFVRAGHGDEVFLFGQTKASGSSMIYNAGYGVPGAGMLIMRMSPDLSARRWSTVFGTPGRINLSPTAFAADICNRVYAAGWGRDFVGYNGVQWHTAGTTGMETSSDAYSDTTDGQDFYIISLDADGNSMQYATFFGEMHHSGTSGGGDHVDGGTSRFDRLATLYQSVCASCGGYDGFPTTAEAWSDSNRASNCNNALFRFNVTNNFPVAEFVLPTAGCAPYTVQFQNTGRGTAFHWDFGDGATSNETNPQHTYTEGGIYTVTLVATMPGGCSEADTQRHSLHVIQNGTLSTTNYIACGGTQVQIGPQPQLGATYLWLTNGVSDPTVANPWVTAEGTYLLRVSTSGCNEVDTFVVQTYQLADQWEVTEVSCHGYNDGSIRLRLGNGIMYDSVAVTVSPNASMTFDGERHIDVTGLSAGTYHVTIAGYGCTFERDFQLHDKPAPPYSKEVSPALCDDSCTGWIQIHYNLGGTATDTLMEGLCAGTHVCNLVSDGCPLSDTTVIARDHSVDSLRAWADSYELYLGQSTVLHAAAEGNGAVAYHWSPEGDIETPDEAETVVTPSDTVACYAVVATSEAGCTASDTLCIHCTQIICGAPEFVIPNAITPNGDGLNDRLCFQTDVLKEFSIAVFNRWGECVFSTNDPTECWDGTFRNTPCLAGVYTYTCHIRCHNDEENDFKGDITIIR